jgi:hypothetical protein
MDFLCNYQIAALQVREDVPVATGPPNVSNAMIVPV